MITLQSRVKRTIENNRGKRITDDELTLILFQLGLETLGNSCLPEHVTKFALRHFINAIKLYDMDERFNHWQRLNPLDVNIKTLKDLETRNYNVLYKKDIK